MPNNRVIYFGTILLVATVLLWIGAELAKRIDWLLPYFGAAAVVLIVAGFIHEAWKSRSIARTSLGARPPGTTEPDA
jgi:hypothetical protein